MPALQLDNLDKSTWQTFRFEQIARSIGERVEPSNTDLETYVGLEHIDPESIHIKRFGTKADVSGTKLRCYPGDVIFGRRRAYQRKAAICEFDGFCSAHSLVLRANPKVIDLKLFPFFLHSDTFMHRAVDISVGSLSPTINWTTLKTQEFLLPPKDQQAKLAELLWAADAAQQQSATLVAKLITQLRSTREHLISASADAVLPLEELCKKKISYGIVQAGPHIENGLPYIKSSDMKEDGIDPDSLQRTSAAIYAKYARSEVVPGELVFSLRGNLGEVQRVPAGLERANLTQGTARLSPNDKVSADYLMVAVRSDRVQRMITAMSKGSTFKEISLADLRRVKIPIHKSKAKQAAICELVASVAAALSDAKDSQAASANLLKSLTNQIF